MLENRERFRNAPLIVSQGAADRDSQRTVSTKTCSQQYIDQQVTSPPDFVAYVKVVQEHFVLDNCVFSYRREGLALAGARW
jgi:hypothetical protein